MDFQNQNFIRVTFLNIFIILIIFPNENCSSYFINTLINVNLFINVTYDFVHKNYFVNILFLKIY